MKFALCFKKKIILGILITTFFCRITNAFLGLLFLHWSRIWVFFNGVLILIYYSILPEREDLWRVYLYILFYLHVCDYLEFGFSANKYMLTYWPVFYFVGGKMLTSERAQFWLVWISQSISEGSMIDMEAQKSSKNYNITGMGRYNCFDVFIHYQQLLQVYFWKVLQKKWNELENPYSIIEMFTLSLKRAK